MHILLLSDGIVGHYKQSEGIVAALARLRPVTITRFTIPFPKRIPRKLLPHLARHLSPSLFLRLCGIAPAQFQKPDLIVSAGGATLGFNTALASLFNVTNIFSGSSRGFSPDRITLTLLPYPSASTLAGHLYTLKPSTVDPDALPAPQEWKGFENIRASLLIGGSTNHMPFTAEEWLQLVRFTAQTASSHKIRWSIVTSRRTPDAFYTALDCLDPDARALLDIIDFRKQGAGSIDAAYAADFIAVTGDSLSMVSESVATNRPTLVLFPSRTLPFRDHEAIRALEDEKRLVVLPIERLSIENLEENISHLQLRPDNHLNYLGQSLLARLPL